MLGMLKVGNETRFFWSKMCQPRLLPGESVLFSKKKLWYYKYRYPPWSYGEGEPLPLILNVSFHITDKRAALVVQHERILNIEMSFWLPRISAPEATEFIRSVAVREKHFGTVKFDFFGLRRWRFGISRTPFDKSGGNVPYLEIISGRPGESRSRTVEIYMGIGKEADEELESAHNVLLDKLQAD